VVHPGAGNADGTLVNGLLNYSSDQGFLPRAGIVHRLDKDTSGIMVVAKTEVSYLNLVGQLKERTVKREYLALVVGQPVSGGVINRPIGRHPKHRTKQAVVESGKEAITDYKIKEKLHGYSLLLASLKTGRTHQIRVHFSSKDFPIVGDPLYGGKRKFAPGTSEDLKKEISELNRQALHAYSLSFIHPVDQNIITNTAPMPNDMKKLIKNLRQHASSS
jgi:23S rRNA pseudouridine1911/1915/1917 synthase